jgi:protein-tyrosine phosphatase
MTDDKPGGQMDSRIIDFEGILNFRDIGGYHTKTGNTIARRRVFRSGELRRMTRNDLTRLKEEIKLHTVIDLRSNYEAEQLGTGLLANSGIKYHNISLVPDGGEREANQRMFKGLANMGELYFIFIQQKQFSQRMLEVLEIIAESENHPLIFHCSAGKDRTGILAAVVLSILEVGDKDIVNDYCLSSARMDALHDLIINASLTDEEIKSLADYHWKADEAAMRTFLTSINNEYGSIRGYLDTQGADKSLVKRLEKALLV